uniref:Uncharacterized protein n=1 Tax=Steinernema glaseri TaxID=37863 RepID=A0A1I7YXK2_9BILA
MARLSAAAALHSGKVQFHGEPFPSVGWLRRKGQAGGVTCRRRTKSYDPKACRRAVATILSAFRLGVCWPSPPFVVMNGEDNKSLGSYVFVTGQGACRGHTVEVFDKLYEDYKKAGSTVADEKSKEPKAPEASTSGDEAIQHPVKLLPGEYLYGSEIRFERRPDRSEGLATIEEESHQRFRIPH